MTKREFANTLFNSNLPLIAEKGAKEFRKFVTSSIEAEFQVSHSAAAAMYNHAKKAALKAGLIDEFGRAYKAKPRKATRLIDADGNFETVEVKTVKARTKSKVAKAAEADAAFIVVKEDGEVVGFYTTATEAEKSLKAGERVEVA